MIKFVRISILLLCIALFAGCGNENMEAIQPNDNDSEITIHGSGQMTIPNNLTVETWNPTMGNVTWQEATPTYKVYIQKPGEVWVDETRYMPLSYLWNRKDIQFTSGWKIQLDALYLVDISSYGHIYSCDCEDPPVVFTYDTFFGDVALYFRPDIAEKGVAAFSFGEFNVLENTSPYSNEEIRKFWDVHTGNDEYDFFSGAWLDASWNEMKAYSVLLQHNEIPAITYQMKFCIYENFLMIQNINTNAVVYVEM